MLRELEARVKDAQAELKLRFLEELEPGDSKAAALDDDTKLGKVSLVSGQVRPVVTDGRALLEWVRQHRPDEIVPTVRDSFLAALKDSAKKHGAAVIESTGEVVPGIEVREGSPYVSFRAQPGAGEVIAQRWQELLGDALKALPGGGS